MHHRALHGLFLSFSETGEEEAAVDEAKDTRHNHKRVQTGIHRRVIGAGRVVDQASQSVR